MAAPEPGANPNPTETKAQIEVQRPRVSANGTKPRRATTPAAPILVPVRPRGLFSSIRAVLLEPAVFFRSLPAAGTTVQWVIIAAVILLLIGFSAVRQKELSPSISTPDAGFPVDVGMPMDGGFGGPPPGITPGETNAGTESNTSSTWTTGIIAASSIVLGWLILLPLLAIVSLLRGRKPQFGRNWQIAIWASLPLGLMAALQLLYYANGGQLGGSGLSGLLPELDGYAEWSPLAKNLALSLAGYVTLFWIWSLLLIYFGARHALQGHRWAAALVVVLWVAVQVILPVATGAVDAQKLSGGETPIDGGMMPGMGEMPIDGGMPDGGLPDGGLPDGMPSEELPEGFSLGDRPGMIEGEASPEATEDSGLIVITPEAEVEAEDAAEEAPARPIAPSNARSSQAEPTAIPREEQP